MIKFNSEINTGISMLWAFFLQIEFYIHSVEDEMALGCIMERRKAEKRIIYNI